MLEFKLPGLETAKSESRPIPPSESERYDVIIAGGGPAGTTAALYCCRKGLKTLMITENIGGQMLWTSGIENYLGYQYITGPELVAKFDAQIRAFPLALAEPVKVTNLEPGETGFVLTTSDHRTFRGRAAIIATGKRPRQLGIPGEQELIGRGVTYCATCDAPLYAGRDVAVIGGGNSALTSLLDLAGVARTVYSFHRSESYRADAVLVEKVTATASVRRLLNYEPLRILGEGRVAGIEVRNRATGAVERYDVAGIFIEIGSMPSADFVGLALELNNTGEIVVNCRAETSLPGVFAAGDVTSVIDKQIIIAAGEGAKAALAAHAWLLARRD